MAKRKFSQEQLDYIRGNYTTQTDEYIAELFDVSIEMVANERLRMGLNKKANGKQLFMNVGKKNWG